MCTAQLRRARSMVALHSEDQFLQDGSTVIQVKISNLNQATTRGHLKSRLQQFKVIDIKLIKCRNSRVNYAYIHLPDHDSADRLVRTVHKRMEIHSNLLKAVFQGGRYIPQRGNSSLSSYSQPGTTKKDAAVQHISEVVHQSLEKKDVDQNLVKLLVYDKNTSTTVSQIKLYFVNYGDIDGIVSEHEDHPRHTNIHFTNAVSAHAARYDSPHSIHQAFVIALPLPGEDAVKNIITKEYPCDPLVIENASKALSQELQSDAQIKIMTTKSTVVAHQMERSNYEHRILHVIKTCESKICYNKMELGFHWLPILAQEDTQKQLLAFSEPCDIKIYRRAEVVSLEKLNHDCSSIKTNNPATIAALKQYLSPSTSASDKTKHQWYWQDDDKEYKPYTEEVNKRIEIACKDQSSCLQEIGNFCYIINCTTMTQTNTSTGRSRPLKRTQIDIEETLVVTLKLHAHEKSLMHFKKAVLNSLARFSAEAKVDVPKTALPMSAFQDIIEKWKKTNSIKVTLDKDEGAAVVSLQGKPILVRTAEAELHKVILKVLADKSFHVTLPSSWEPQTKKCELKPVRKGTPEWTNIQDLMEQTNFRIRIIKLERIQNTWLWELYQLSKKRMSEKNEGEVNEKLLFHGTRQTSPKDIYDSEQGFDNRLASQGLWGEGTYFAVMAKYSDTYAHTLDNGYKQMFLANVITGISCKFSTQDSSLKVPPKKEDRRSFLSSLFWSSNHKFEGERYDSVTATTNGSKIYVIYELGRVYPAYLITYSEL